MYYCIVICFQSIFVDNLSVTFSHQLLTGALLGNNNICNPIGQPHNSAADKLCVENLKLELWLAELCTSNWAQAHLHL